MVQEKGGAPAGGKDDGKDKAKQFVFFVNKERFETDQAELTAGQIKARVAGVEPGDKLSIDGQGDEPDRMLSDDELVKLEKDKGPLRFTIVPSASFGA